MFFGKKKKVNGYVIKPKANLHRANLDNVKLIRADLQEANLYAAKLS